MGYCVDMTVRVKIPKEKKEEMFHIFEVLDATNLCWVSKGFSKLKTVKAVFNELGYNAILSTKGYYLVNERFFEKIGDDKLIWKSLAPVIMDGSYIKCAGEDHAKWRWRFKDGICHEQWARDVYS